MRVRFSTINLAKLCALSALVWVATSPLSAGAKYPTFYISQQHFIHSLQELPPKTQEYIQKNKSRFIKLLRKMAQDDPDLSLLVDKQHRLSANHAPRELLDLSETSWAVLKRQNLPVSRLIVENLEKMVRAAARDGITLEMASGYRSHSYQREVYRSWVKKLGKKSAARLSAPAGASQHQLGTVIDFYPVDRRFTGTPAQRWLSTNAGKYGFSLSYPAGHEAQTGYTYESWHYRYIGPAACQLQREFFDNLQYQLLTWWQANKRLYLRKNATP